MRRLAALSLAAALLAAPAPALLAQSRARRVPPPAATTTTAPQPAPAGDASRRPPTIKTSSTGGGGQTAAGGVATAREPEAAGPLEVGDDEVISVNTTLVTMPVSVRDRDGKYIPNLAKQDFRIFEDNVEQQVAYFAATEKPFTVALVLDTSGSTRNRMNEIQDAAIAFVDQLRPEDRVMVVTFDDQISVLSHPTNDRRALRDAIRRSRAGNGTRLYDAVDLVINTHLRRVEGRKAVVLFTDGVDTTSKQASYQSNMEDAEEADALIYPVQYDTYDDTQVAGGGGGSWPGGGGGRYPGRRRTGSTIGDILGGILGGGGVVIGGGSGRGGNWPGGRGGGNCSGCTREEYERADRYLGELARLTGARRYRSESTRDLEGTFALVAEELRRQYSLGYYPARQPRPGERRRIKVRVMRPDLVVQARDSYVFGQPQGGATATAQQNGGQQQQQQQQTRPVIRRQPFDRAAVDSGKTHR
jgi:VWFA-related protein